MDLTPFEFDCSFLHARVDTIHVALIALAQLFGPDQYIAKDKIFPRFSTMLTELSMVVKICPIHTYDPALRHGRNLGRLEKLQRGGIFGDFAHV